MELILTIESSKDETSLRNRPSPVRQLCVVNDQGRQGLVTGRLPIMLAAGSSEKPLFNPMGADDTYFYCGFDPGNPEHPDLCGNRVWKSGSESIISKHMWKLSMLSNSDGHGIGSGTIEGTVKKSTNMSSGRCGLK